MCSLRLRGVTMTHFVMVGKYLETLDIIRTSSCSQIVPPSFTRFLYTSKQSLFRRKRVHVVGIKVTAACAVTASRMMLQADQTFLSIQSEVLVFVA